MGHALTAAPERRLLVVAGETSGDHHAANLIRELRGRVNVRVRGVAGPRMRAEGVEAIVPQEQLAVLGFSGIVAKLPLLLDTRRRLVAELEAFRPDAVLLVDYPGFNLRLGPQLHRRGARVIQYVAPQVWAWHPERAAQMAAWVDRLLVVFPFEEPIFRDAGCEVRFVGHPLLDDLEPEVDAATLRAELGVAADRPLLGLLPGSRPQELAMHADVLVESARRVLAARPDVVPVLAMAPGLDEGRLPAGARDVVRVVRGRTRAVQAAATVCAVASGTATLETALFGTPLVVIYRTGWLNAFLARRLVKIPRIGLPNIVAGHEVAPELLQEALTPDALSKQLLAWLADPAALAARREALAVVRERLGGPGASARAAAAVAERLA